MWPFSKKAKPATQDITWVKKPTATGFDLFSTGGIEHFNGDKFPGGFGRTKIFRHGSLDFFTLRERSNQLYYENDSAQGLINRLITNVINTGLKLQATPESDITGMSEEKLEEWTDTVEQKFKLYTDDKQLIKREEQSTFNQLEEQAYLTALLSGDCLIVNRVVNPVKLPKVQVIDGRDIRTPFGVTAAKGKKIENGVELDSKGRHVAYWIFKTDKIKGNHFVRIPAFGEKTKRRLAWMVYAGVRKSGQTRGVPLLACCLQGLKEIDRFKDAELRSAWINAIIALFIEREVDVTPTQGIGRNMGVASDTVDTTNPDGTTKENDVSFLYPGIMMDKLQPGEKPTSFDTKRPNVNFKDFVRAVLAGIAWSQGIPPEILFLEFQNSFSASRQANNEFLIFLKKVRKNFSQQFNKPIYEEWLTDYILQGKLEAPGYLESLRDPTQWEVRNAWKSQKWIGVARPSVDLLKEVKAYGELVDRKFASHEDAVQELRGDDFNKVITRQKAEKSKLKDLEGEEELIEPVDPANSDPSNVEVVNFKENVIV